MNGSCENIRRMQTGGARITGVLLSASVAVSLLAGCNTAEDAGYVIGQALTEAPTDKSVLEEAELVRLANALSWKRGISGDQAFSIIRAAARKGDAELAPYRKIEREHARVLRQRRLDDIRARSGGGNGTGGNSGNSGGHTH